MTATRAWRVRILALTAITASVLLVASAAYAEWFLPETQLTTRDVHQRNADVSGTKVVYEDYRNYVEPSDDDEPEDDWDIYVLDTETRKSLCLTPYHTAHGRPSISGARVVWYDRGHGSSPSGVYYRNLDNGKTKRLPFSAWAPRISGERVTYYSAGHVYVYNIVTGKKKRLTPTGAMPGSPDISEKKIAYEDSRDGNPEIYVYNLVTGQERRVTSNADSQFSPAISTNRIVWEDHRNGNWDIYMFDLQANALTQVTDEADDQVEPAISGNMVVWDDHRNATEDIYVYDIRAGVEQRVTLDPANQESPSIAGSRIVYHDDRNVNHDLYVTRLVYPKLSASTAPTVPYGGSAHIVGTLLSADGAPLPGLSVRLQTSVDKIVWSDSAASAVTSISGQFALDSSPLTAPRYLRVVTLGDSAYPSAASSAMRVVPASP